MSDEETPAKRDKRAPEIHRLDAFQRLLRLKRLADEKVLRVSPPYVDPDAQSAFIAGYDACLSDFARGELKVDADA